MAKKTKKPKKSKKADRKAEAAAAKKAEKRTAKKAAKIAKHQAKQNAKGAPSAATQQAAVQAAVEAAVPPPAPPTRATVPDQVELLKLALRDTEAKLVDAEHRLRQVQQQLDDERRALAEAAEEAVEEAVVEAAVEETVAEAVLDAEVVSGGDLAPAEVAEVIAETLDELAAEVDPGPEEPLPDPVVDHTGEAEAAAAVFTAAENGDAPAAKLTPPLPEEPPAEVPSEEWTLVRLRQEARRRGLSDTSNLPKARLLERLRES